MRSDVFTKVFLIFAALLLLLNFVQGLGVVQPALAEKGNGTIGRYQIAAWAAQAGARTHHNGYYVVDTVTEK